MAVDFALVEWNDYAVPAHDLDQLHADDLYDDFYALWSARQDEDDDWETEDLLYIGMAYSQPIKERIAQDHASWKRVADYLLTRRDREIVVVTGWLCDKSLERETRQLVEDVEALLILHNQPEYNSKHKKTYNGRSPFVVMNRGDFEPLERFAPSTTRALNMFRNDYHHVIQENLSDAE